MNIWTKIFYSILLLTIHCSSAAQGRFNPAKLEYRRASIADFEQINSLYLNRTSHDDRKKLLILPRSFQSRALRTAIEKGRVFIALNQETVVSVINIFVMGATPQGLDTAEARQDAMQEERRILEDELRCRSGSRQYEVESCYQADCYHQIDVLFSTDLMPRFVENPNLCYTAGQKQTYIYVGRALTDPTYRGQGINTRLEEFGLRSIKGDVLRDILMRQSEQLFYVYGLVESTAQTTEVLELEAMDEFRPLTAHIRAFTRFVLCLISSRSNEPIDVEHEIRFEFYMFRTFKPAFTVTEKGLLNRLPDHNKRAGYGCLIECSLKDAQFRRPDSPEPAPKKR